MIALLTKNKKVDNVQSYICLHMFVYADHVSYTNTLEVTDLSHLLLISSLTCEFTRPSIRQYECLQIPFNATIQLNMEENLLCIFYCYANDICSMNKYILN